MTANIYLVKALDYYPYNLEEALESLNYAMAYEENNPIALCLMGRVQLEIFKDYKLANTYFREALAASIDYLETYTYFLDCLLIQEEFEEMEKLVAFAQKRKGVDRGLLFYYEALRLEKQLKFKKAQKAIKEAMLLAQTGSFMSDLEEMKKRVEKKSQL
jgi:tetratricopeptide (TPR) repeat protein